MAGHDEDLVLIDEFLRRQHRLLGVVARILDLQHDAAPVHPALLVELVHAQLHARPHLLAIARQRPGQVLDRAHGDLGLADALRLRLSHAGGQREAGKEEQAFLHGGVSWVGL